MMEIVNIDAVLAQLVEQPPCKRQVVGAEPTHGSIFLLCVWRNSVGYGFSFILKHNFSEKIDL